MVDCYIAYMFFYVLIDYNLMLNHPITETHLQSTRINSDFNDVDLLAFWVQSID